MKISPQLASQHFNKHLIADALLYLGRDKWEYQCNRYQLEFEPWATGIWVKQEGIVSYREYAEYFREITKLEAYGLNVRRQSRHVFLVEGRRQPWYPVVRVDGRYSCGCMLYRCRRNRLENELPQLFEGFNRKIFCHHTIAAHYSTQAA